jgi:carbon starvation protein
MIAVGSALLLAFYNGSGKGAMTLWPLFGCTNQLLAALSLLVVTVYLAHKKYPVIYTMIPMLLMVVLTGWAMYYTIAKFYHDKNWLLLFIGLIIVVLEIWMIIESSLLMKELLKSKTPTVSKA